METLKNKRVLITTKLSNYPGHFRDFVTLDEISDWGVCKMLIKYFHTDIFIPADNSFRSRFEEFTIIDPDTDDVLPVDFSRNDFIDNLEFKRQVVDNPVVFRHFIEALGNSDFLKKSLLNNKDGSIWVMPTINDNYHDDNISYIESLISFAGRDCSELILLLHDKDIYNTKESIKHHQVAKSDISLSSIIQDDSALMSLINGGKVFVFIHNSDEDTYCKSIVNNENLKEMTSSEIIDNLVELPKNVAFSTQLGGVRRLSEMESIIENTKENYDFSKVFI